MVGDTIKSFKKVASGAIEPVKRIADDTTEQVRRIADGTIEPVRNFVDDNMEPVNRLADGTIMPIRLLTGSKSADDIPDKIDMEYREKIVVRTSLVGIIANILLAAVKALLAIKTKAKFNDQMNKLVKTDAEKRMLVELAFKAGAEDAESWKVDALRELSETTTKL